MRRLILGVALLSIIVGAAALGFAGGGHATSAPAAAPVYLYWANSTAGRGAPWAKRPAATSIGRARLDGTGVEHSFVSGTGRGPCGVALDGAVPTVMLIGQYGLTVDVAPEDSPLRMVRMLEPTLATWGIPARRLWSNSDLAHLPSDYEDAQARRGPAGLVIPIPTAA